MIFARKMMFPMTMLVTKYTIFIGCLHFGPKYKIAIKPLIYRFPLVV